MDSILQISLGSKLRLINAENEDIFLGIQRLLEFHSRYHGPGTHVR